MTENKEILDWARDKGYNNYSTTGRQNNKLDNRILVWESEWSNFKEATEFADDYIQNDFMKQNYFNFDLTEHMSKFDHKELIQFTAEEIYINRGLNGIYKKQIDAYKEQKSGLYPMTKQIDFTKLNYYEQQPEENTFSDIVLI